MTAFGDWQGSEEEIKLFPSPHYSGEPDKWEVIEVNVTLYKTAVREVVELTERAAAPITDQDIGQNVFCWRRLQKVRQD